MNRQLPLLATALVLALAAGARGIGVTGELDVVLADIEARRAEFLAQSDAPGRRSARIIGRAARFLKRRSVGRSLVGEISGAKRAAGLLEARFPEETDILAGFVGPSGNYLERLIVSTQVLGAQSEAPGLRRARRRALRAKLARAEAGLEAASTAATIKARLGAYLRVARATRASQLTGEDYAWVVSSLSVADRADALGDHKLADAADVFESYDLDLDELLSNAVVSGPDVLILELWGVDGFTRDSFVFAAALSAADTDGNAADNFTGSEVFLAGLEIDGHGLMRAGAALDGGVYDVELTATATVAVAGLAVDPGETLRIVGTAGEETNSGRFALTVSLSELLDLLSRSGEDVPLGLVPDLEALVDVDTNGDEQPNAFSATLDFNTAGASVTSPQ